MRSCKTASELTTLDQVRPLSLTEKISLLVHRAICGPCRAYKKQMDRLRGELSEISEQESARGADLGSDARRRILDNIQAQTEKHSSEG